ncbi:MAG: tetratricopeptide repeat protein [Actinomycetota bacterium]|nr:tetratricopeptide repeat protein [Actinomycetota bacterium]
MPAPILDGTSCAAAASCTTSVAPRCRYATATTSPVERDEIREAIFALFADLGHEHPLTQRYRRQLASTLY